MGSRPERWRAVQRDGEHMRYGEQTREMGRRYERWGADLRPGKEQSNYC
jgi:hypothetical protein